MSALSWQSCEKNVDLQHFLSSRFGIYFQKNNHDVNTLQNNRVFFTNDNAFFMCEQ